MRSSFATRRLWMRRFRNFALFVFPPLVQFFAFILSPITGAFKLLRAAYRDGGLVVFTIVLAVISFVVYMVGLLTYYQTVGRNVATVEDIIEFRKADPCQDNTLLVRTKQRNAPVLNFHLWEIERDCKEYWEKKKAQTKQEAALKKQLEGMK